jgi:prevent-host-death family protein
MNTIPQIVPITDLRIKHAEVLRMLHKGPVILAQRSRPTAVLVSVEEWDRQADELKRLKRILMSDQYLAEMRQGNYLAHEQLDTERIEKV